MNLANRITLVRIALIPVFLILLLSQHTLLGLAIFFVTAITDAIDGFIARSKQQRTRLGSFLDPLADKLLLTTSFIALATLQILPSWLMVFVVSRDMVIISGIFVVHFFSGKFIISPSILGKSSSAMQMITVAFGLLFYALDFSSPFLTYLCVLTVFLTLASGMQYIYQGAKMLNGTVEEARKTAVS